MRPSASAYTPKHSRLPWIMIYKMCGWKIRRVSPCSTTPTLSNERGNTDAHPHARNAKMGQSINGDRYTNSERSDCASLGCNLGVSCTDPSAGRPRDDHFEYQQWPGHGENS